MPHKPPAASSLASLSEVPGTELRRLNATFETFGDFVDRYSPWLSDSNIFVETAERIPVGAPVSLEIRVRHRSALIRALGQIDWVRETEDDEAGPPGVAISISYLDPASARLIDSIFRLYIGQKSANLGEKIEETWEHDVESLIDFAFAENLSEQSQSKADASAPAKPGRETPLDPGDPSEPSPAETVMMKAVPMESEENSLLADSPDVAPVFDKPVDVPQAAEPQVAEPRAAEPPKDLEEQWEANLSAAFSEAENIEETAEPSSFGFGLVEEPSPTTPTETPVPVQHQGRSLTDVLSPLPTDVDTTGQPASEAWSANSFSPSATQPIKIPTAVDLPVATPVAAGTAAASSTHQPHQPSSAVKQHFTPPPTSTTSLLEPNESRPEAIEPVPTPSSPTATGRLDPVPTTPSSSSFLRRSGLLFLLALVIGTILFFVFLRPQSPDDVPIVDVVPTGVALTPEATNATEPVTDSQATDGQAIDDQTTGSQTTGQPGPTTSEVATVAGPVAEPRVEPSGVVAPPEPSAEPDPATVVEEVERLIQTWAKAWSQQSPADFIACYVAGYSPAGLTNEQWQQQRRDRISAPASILVQPKNFEIEARGANRAVATFFQDYTTDTKHLLTWKTMELSRQPEGWRIVSERTGR